MLLPKHLPLQEAVARREALEGRLVELGSLQDDIDEQLAWVERAERGLETETDMEDVQELILAINIVKVRTCFLIFYCDSITSKVVTCALCLLLLYLIIFEIVTFFKPIIRTCVVR